MSDETTSTSRFLIPITKIPSFVLIMSPVIIIFILFLTGGHGLYIVPAAMYVAVLVVMGGGVVVVLFLSVHVLVVVVVCASDAGALHGCRCHCGRVRCAFGCYPCLCG